MSEKKIDAEVIQIEKADYLKKESKQIKTDKSNENIVVEFGGKEIHVIAPPYDLKKLAEFYENNTWHYRCVNIKAYVSVGSGYEIIPIKDKTSEKNKLKIESLTTNVNPHDTFAGVLVKGLIDYDSVGNAYLELVRNKKGDIVEIYHVPAYSVRIKSDGTGYVQVINGKTVEFKKFGDTDRPDLNELVHIKNYYPLSSYYGIPDFLPALGAINLTEYAEKFNLNFFNNNAMPSMAIITEGGKLSDEAKKTVKEFLTSKLKGVENAHKVLYVPTQGNVKVKFEKLMTEIKDYSFRSLRLDNRDEVISAHGVPPRLVGVMTAGQLGGASEAYGQLDIFKNVVINPRQNKIEFVLKKIFLSMGIDDWAIKFKELETNKDKKLTLDKKMDIATKLFDRKALGVNEIRSFLGLEPYPEEEAKAIDELNNINNILKQIEKAKKALEDEDY